MEHELWAWIMRAIRDVRRSSRDTAYHTHRTDLIVRVYLWAVLHDRPTAWACDRRAWIATLEPNPPLGRTYGEHLKDVRRKIETTFGNLAAFSAGLTHLPPWVRGLTRVRLFVHAKLLINAARIRRTLE